MRITSISRRPSTNEFFVVTYFFEVISVDKKSMSFRRTFFDIVLIDEKLAQFGTLFYCIFERQNITESF